MLGARVGDERPDLIQVRRISHDIQHDAGRRNSPVLGDRRLVPHVVAVHALHGAVRSCISPVSGVSWGSLFTPAPPHESSRDSRSRFSLVIASSPLQSELKFLMSCYLHGHVPKVSLPQKNSTVSLSIKIRPWERPPPSPTPTIPLSAGSPPPLQTNPYHRLPAGLQFCLTSSPGPSSY